MAQQPWPRRAGSRFLFRQSGVWSRQQVGEGALDGGCCREAIVGTSTNDAHAVLDVEHGIHRPCPIAVAAGVRGLLDAADVAEGELRREGVRASASAYLASLPCERDASAAFEYLVRRILASGIGEEVAAGAT